jgi:hypothetical protein
MNETGNDNAVDFEGQINKRRDALVARKRAENESTIARITTLDTGWEDVNGDIDTDLKGGLDSVGVEAQAIQDARDRLTRNVCEGVDKNAFAIAGKLVDIKSKVGLPGLTVEIGFASQNTGAQPAGGQPTLVLLRDAASAPTGSGLRINTNFQALDGGQSIATETDNFGDFFFSLPLGASALTSSAAAGQISALILVQFGDTVVFRQERTFAPKAGATEHVTIEIDCSGKLKDVLEHGKQVAASVESDAKLVETRSANFQTAYATFKQMSDATLSQLRLLKADLSGGAPQPAPAGATPTRAATAAQPTRFLGNSHQRELHDLENTKKQCHIDDIKADHRVYFRSEREAVAAGYDYCRYCFGKQKSKR